MAQALNPPTVTETDLLAFHSKTFARPFEGPLPLFPDYATQSHDDQGQSGEYYDEAEYEAEYEDDGLGHYPDGVKRTLTNDEIAIFRHSEIQQILARKRRQEEEKAFEQEYQQAGADLEPKGAPAKEDSTDEGEVSEQDDDDTEYARFLEQEKEQFAIDAAKKRTQTRGKQGDRYHESQPGYDRTVSTRRKVREMDETIKQSDVVLEY